MRVRLIIPALSLLAAPTVAAGAVQEVVQIPSTDAPTVARPDDLFNLPPGQWHFAKQLWSGNEPCDDKHCEAGFTSGDLAVSVERSEKFVRIIAGLKTCEGVGFSEMETGNKPGRGTRKKVAKQVGQVAKGLAKSCNTTVPDMPALDVALLFPAKVEQQ